MGKKLHDCTCGAFEDACLDKAKVGEPIFVLRGQDKTAPEVVEWWARKLMDRYYDHDPILPPSVEEKIDEAYECVDQMRAWEPRKVPD